MESIQIISLVLSIVACLLWVASIPLVFMAWIELKTFMKSTHNIEWMPVPLESQIDDKPATDKPEEIGSMEKTLREMEELEEAEGINIKNFP